MRNALVLTAMLAVATAGGFLRERQAQPEAAQVIIRTLSSDSNSFDTMWEKIEVGKADLPHEADR